MATEKKQISIAKKNKDVFSSVYDLIKNIKESNSPLKMAFRAFDASDENGVLHVGNNNFDFVISENDDVSDEGGKFEMTDQGATWFARLRKDASQRGDESQGEDNIAKERQWQEFVGNVSKTYHTHTGIIQYYPKEDNQDYKKELDNELEKFIKEFFHRVHEILGKDNENNVTYVNGWKIEPRSVPDYDEIYCANLKLGVSHNGTDQSILLCKIFFKQSNGKMTPLDKETAKTLDDHVKHDMDEDDNSHSSQDSSGDNKSNEWINIVTPIMDELEKMIIDGNDFFDYLCLAGKSDQEILDRFKQRTGGGDTVEIECENMQVLGFYHMKWKIPTGDVIDSKGNHILRLKLGGGKASLYCLNCIKESSKEDYLVEDNEITYTITDKENVSLEKKFRIDKQKGDFGLYDVNEEDRVAIATVWGEHLQHKTCNIFHKPSCPTRIRCRSQLDEKAHFCNDCPNPEVVYRGVFGVVSLGADSNDPNDKITAALTSELCFISDSLEMKMKTVSTNCRLCGRSVAKVEDRSVYCAVCEKLRSCVQGDQGAEALNLRQAGKKNYRKVASMLAPWQRVGGKKYSFSDDEYVLIVAGNKVYMYEKLSESAMGFKRKPKFLKDVKDV